MKGYYIIIDNLKSFFSEESDISTFMIKPIIIDSKSVLISKENFILLLENKIDFLIPKLTNNRSAINLNRLKYIEYKEINLILNLKNKIDFLIFSLIKLYYLTENSISINVEICKN